MSNENDNKAVFYINDGAGLGEYVETGTSLANLLEQKNVTFGNYQVRVNRQSVEADYTIRAGDVISVVPTKVDGGK